MLSFQGGALGQADGRWMKTPKSPLSPNPVGDFETERMSVAENSRRQAIEGSTSVARPWSEGCELSIDLEELAAVIRLLKEADFSELRYSKGDTSLVVRRGDMSTVEVDYQPIAVDSRAAPAWENSAAAGQAASLAAAVAAQVLQQEHQGPTTTINAPILGSFYRAAKPGEAPFVKVGDVVEPNSVVCIIEVMKLMNSVEAGVSGVISAIHVENGELVEHGQALFSVRLGETA